MCQEKKSPAKLMPQPKQASSCGRTGKEGKQMVTCLKYHWEWSVRSVGDWKLLSIVGGTGTEKVTQQDEEWLEGKDLQREKGLLSVNRPEQAQNVCDWEHMTEWWIAKTSWLSAPDVCGEIVGISSDFHKAFVNLISHRWFCPCCWTTKERIHRHNLSF